MIEEKLGSNLVKKETSFFQPNNFRVIIVHLLLLNVFFCCHKNADNTYFLGDIKYIEDVAKEIHVTLKEVPLNGANYGIIAVYDSLMIFWNPKLQYMFFNIFNLDTGKEIGSFCGKGGGPNEMFGVSPIYQFFEENNDLKTLIFAANENKIFIWNISQSIKCGFTVIDTIIPYNSKNEYGVVAYNYMFYKNGDSLFTHTPTFALNEEEASLSYYQKRTLYSDTLLQKYNIYKKSVRNGKATMIPEFFFASNDAIKPDGSKIAQAMGYLSQINILDTNTGDIIGYRMKNTPDFSFFETRMTLRKTYYTRIQASNKYIYAPYWGKEPLGLREIPLINNIHVFNWNGKLLYKFIVDFSVGEIWLDEIRNRLYITNNILDDVFYLDLNEYP